MKPLDIHPVAVAERQMLIWRVVVLWGALACVAGCASNPQPGIENAHAAYQAGQYGQSLAQARRVMRSGSPVERKEAAYVAGLSAYRLNDLHTASTLLRRAATSSDSALAGDALVMVGLIESEQDDHESAIRAFTDASQRLGAGEDRAKAYFYTAKSQQHLGRWAAARASLSLARTSSSDLGFRNQIARELAVTGFTLQAGAFTRKDNALHAAEKLLVKSNELGLGRPRVVSVVAESRQSLYLVQVGQFSTHATAQAARVKLGNPSAIIVPLK